MRSTHLTLLLVFFLLSLARCKKNEEALPVPTITSITPNAAPAGATLTLKGINFGGTIGDNVVELWQGTSATTATITAAISTSLTLTVPATLSAGDYQIKVKAFGQSSAGSEFEVLPPGPIITRFWPLSAKSNSKITIYGRNFSSIAEENKVLINRDGYSALGLKPEKATDTSLVVTPWGSPGDYTVQVVVNGQKATALRKYNMIDNDPSISSKPFEPASGAPGSTFLLFGSNFNTYAEFDTVFFATERGPVMATITKAMEQALTVTVPTGLAPGVYPVSAHVSGQRAHSPYPFTVLAPAPTITSFSPVSVNPGESLTITGTNFSTIAGQNTVAFTKDNNSMTAGVTSATATSLVLSIPVYVTPGIYQLSVTVNGQNGKSAEMITVTVNPKITSITPTSGTSNSTITINGSGFNPTASSNKVEFVYGAGAAVTATVTSATHNMLKVMVPANLAAEQLPYTVKVTIYGKTVEGKFTVTAPANAPKVTSYNGASSIKPGETLTIMGTNLKASGTVTNVTFTPWPGGGVTTVVSGTPNETGTSLTVTIPSSLATGQYEVSVEVSQAYGSAPDILKVN